MIAFLPHGVKAHQAIVLGVLLGIGFEIAGLLLKGLPSWVSALAVAAAKA
jgi:hypothetical protein